MPAGFHIF